MGYSLWGHKESDMTEQLSTHACTVSSSIDDPSLKSGLAVSQGFISLTPQNNSLELRISVVPVFWIRKLWVICFARATKQHS